MAELVEEIKKRKEEILDNIDRESIDVYIFLRDEFKKSNILDNHVFQFVFRSFYRLDNAGLSDKQKKCFFELLARNRIDLSTVLSELYDIPTLRGKNTIQYSFATKLLHTVDNNTPIFDRFIMMTLKTGNIKGKTKQEKIESRIENYNTLQEKFYDLIEKKEIKEIISQFRERFSIDKTKISDTKVLDFILWSYGKLIDNKIQ